MYKHNIIIDKPTTCVGSIQQGNRYTHHLYYNIYKHNIIITDKPTTCVAYNKGIATHTMYTMIYINIILLLLINQPRV